MLQLTVEEEDVVLVQPVRLHRASGRMAPPSAGTAANGTHARRLQDLFRPPYELMVRMSWDEARTLGKGDQKMDPSQLAGYERL